MIVSSGSPSSTFPASFSPQNNWKSKVDKSPDRVISNVGQDVLSRKQSPGIDIPQTFLRERQPKKLNSEKNYKLKNDAPMRGCHPNEILSLCDSDGIFEMD